MALSLGSGTATGCADGPLAVAAGVVGVAAGWAKRGMATRPASKNSIAKMAGRIGFSPGLSVRALTRRVRGNVRRVTSSHLVDERHAFRAGLAGEQMVDVEDRLLGDEHRTAVRADVRRHVVDDEDALAVDHGMADRLGLVLTGAVWSLASHVVSSCSRIWNRQAGLLIPSCQSLAKAWPLILCNRFALRDSLQ